MTCGDVSQYFASKLTHAGHKVTCQRPPLAVRSLKGSWGAWWVQFLYHFNKLEG
jgi:hypothetical protein